MSTKVFVDTKGVIRIRKLKRTDNTMAKRTNNDLQNMHIKLKVDVVCVVFVICLVSCVPCVTYGSGPLCVWSLSFVLCLVYPVLPMSLDRCVCGLYH
jgi:hypothetical protein